MTEQSFGIIPFHTTQQGIQFLLIHQRPSAHRPQDKVGHWGFPKGHAEEKETPVEAALREFCEETGLAPQNIEVNQKKSFREYYVFTRVFTQEKKRISKTAIYFLGRVIKGRISVQKKEIQDYRWASYSEAMKLLTFPEARKVLTQAHEYLFTKYKSPNK